jgi:hypothetical protein
MEVNSNLPVLVPAVISLFVVSVAAVLALAWRREPDFGRLVRRVWVAAVVVIVGGAAVFWIATAMVEGPRRAPVDRSLQAQQQEELRARLQKGGH